MKQNTLALSGTSPAAAPGTHVPCEHPVTVQPWVTGKPLCLNPHSEQLQPPAQIPLSPRNPVTLQTGSNAVTGAEGWTPQKGSLTELLPTRYLVYSEADGEVPIRVHVYLFITNTNST